MTQCAAINRGGGKGRRRLRCLHPPVDGGPTCHVHTPGRVPKPQKRKTANPVARACKFTGTPRRSEINPETGLSFPLIRCLRAVRTLTARGNRTSQREVADRLQVYPRAAEKVLERLRALGLVHWRSREEARGYCEFCGGTLSRPSLCLTQAGRLVLSMIPAHVAAVKRAA